MVSVRSDTGVDDAAATAFDIFRVLKAGTADIHLQTEERVPIFRPGFDLAAYGRLVECFYGFRAPLEIQLSLLTALNDRELGLESRLKSSFLEEDLRILGRDPAAVRRCVKLPSVDTFPRGVGCLYVLEGSTLGSRFISQRLEKDLGLRAGNGATFFNAYGDSAGRRWAEFRGFVTARVNAEHAEEIVRSARQTFQCFYEWLDAAESAEE